METLAITTLMKGLSGWQAMVDIIVIAAGLFFLYRTLLGLGTWRIVAGIIVALFIFFIANVLNLKGLEWIFGNFSQVALIALIVIFQPELRKIFERAASLRRSEIRDVGAEISHLIVDSLIKLAEQRRGAIVVFPGKEPISAGKSQALNVITTPIYLESIYNDTNIYCKIIAPPAAQPADKRWPDVEVVIQVGY